MTMDYYAEVERLAAELRQRDTDPRCAAWPVEDPYARISHVNTASDMDKPIVQIYFTLQNMLTRDVRLGVIAMDTNRSAWKEEGARPGWDSVVERLVSGVSHGVTSVMIDRMMRQAWSLEDLLRQHKRAHGKARGFTLYDVDSQRLYRTNNIHDLDALRGLVKAAQFDSAVKSAKIVRGNNARRLAGNGRNGPAPFGHRWRVADIPDDQLIAERAAIRWGILRVTDGGSWGEVARRWTADGVLPRWRVCGTCEKRVAKARTRCGCGGTPRAGRWNTNNVRACLYGSGSTPTVGLRHAGLLHTGGQVIGSIVDADGPIVSRAEWDDFETHVSGRPRGRQRGDKESRYYASGTVRCGGTFDDGTFCGTLLVGSVRDGVYADTGERCYSYKCPPRGCAGLSVDGRATEWFASDLVAKVIASGDNIGLLAHVGSSDRLAELTKLRTDAAAAVRTAERQHDAARSPERKAHAAERLIRFELRLSDIDDEIAELERVERQAQLKPSDVDELRRLWTHPATPAAMRQTILADCVPGGFFVRPVGRSARLRGEQIFTRFYLPAVDA